MVNYLKMTKRQQVLSLLELGWTYRRIQTETGVRRETVARYDRARRANAAKVFPGSEPAAEGAEPGNTRVDGSNAAKVFAGSASNAAKAFPGSVLPPRSSAAPYHEAIVEKLDAGLSLQRVWQDLVEEFGFGGSYESIKRYARRLERPSHVVGVYHSAPGEEAQIDFFQGAPTFRAETGQWRRPWVFRMTLCCSRHGYEEAAWDQQIETFLRLHESAFRDLGGVPTICRHDNLPSPGTGASRLFPPAPGPRRKTGRKNAAAATSRTTRSKAGASTAWRSRTSSCAAGTAPSPGSGSTAPPAGRCGPTSSRPTRRLSILSRPNRSPTSSAGRGSCMSTATSR